MAAAAQTVGSALGTLMSRVDVWMAQRDQLAADLRAMADNIASGAANLVGTVSQAGAKATAAAGNLVGTTDKRKRRKMSAAARKAIGDAQRARWAKQKNAEGGTAKSAKKAKSA